MEALLNDTLKRRLEKLKSEERFTFFWETRSPFSQWHKCQFTSGVFDFGQTGLPESLCGDVTFSSAEQFMMLHKAILFGDFDIGGKIMGTRDVREQKKLGRGIKKFEEQLWQKFKVGIVYAGNKNKFMQNPDLMHELLSTKGTTLVEAAPDDAVWGIGVTKEDARAQKRENWPGTNLLGEVLTFIRTESQNEY